MPTEPLDLIVVEDNEDDYRLLLGHLAAAGIGVSARRVDNAASLREALAESPPEAVISDHSLPGFDSIQALEIARGFDPDVPFLLFSGAIGEEGAVAVMQAGADDYVMKDKPGRLVPGLCRAMEVADARRRSRAAEAALRSTEEELRDLASHLAHVREEEREAIARDIHDDVGSTLMAVKLQVALLKVHCSADADALGKLAALSGMLDAAGLAASRIMHDLRPGILDEGIVAALEWQARDAEGRLGFACEFETSDDDLEVDRATSITLFRICQEALSNVAKYAAATRVRIRLEQSDGSLGLTVTDNGMGIHPLDMGKAGCFGLRGMRERATSLGGSVVVAGEPGKGTRVAVTLPSRFPRAGHKEIPA